MADRWLIAKDGEPNKVLAQYGWTAERRSALFFMSESEALAHIESRHILGHTARATADDNAAAPGMPNAAETEYDPYGLRVRYR